MWNGSTALIMILKKCEGVFVTTCEQGVPWTYSLIKLSYDKDLCLNLP